MGPYQVDRDRIRWRAVDGEVVAYDTATGHLLSFNATASALWPLVEQGADRSLLERALEEDHAVPTDTARRDVGEFLDQLAALGVLRSR